MSKKLRKALKNEIKSQSYGTPSNGCKLYVFTYGAEILFTYETETYNIITKETAFHIINDIFEDNEQEPITNIHKVNFFRVA
ncbi:MAG: hypothetical protein NC452_05000 [Eubacterium sp.]|nr:hypothetical protein [Eubacterium sp.]